MQKGSRHSRVTIDKVELIELVKHNPELYDSSHERANDKEHVESVWEEIANKLKAPVEAVQKKWLNIKNVQGRRASLRSATNLNFLSRPEIKLSNENSCASSICSSPKDDEKHSTRSISQLSSSYMTELDRWPIFNSDYSPHQSIASSVTQTKSTRSKNERYQASQPSPEDVTRQRLSESFLASKKALEDAVNSETRRLSDMSCIKNEIQKGIVSDPMRTFFESMAMTVSTFPQHIQATIKLQICNIIQETEYRLSVPKDH